MNLQRALNSLRLVLRTQIPRDVYGKYQVAARIYIYIYIYVCICIDSSDSQHYFLSKLKFLHNSTLLFLTTPAIIR
jgi:hypothetical protein